MARTSRISGGHLWSMVQQAPDMVGFALRFGLRKRLTVNLDYRREDCHSAAMKQVNIKITNACNLRCKTCAQWGEAGYMVSAPSSVVKEHVPVEVYERMVDDVVDVKPWVYIWGGEPFLYPDLIRLLAYIKQRGLLGSVVTNGTRLARHAQELVDIGLDAVMVSLDGPREAHDTIRGVPGTFDALMLGVEAIQEERQRRGRVKPRLTLAATVSRDNADKLDQIVDIGEKMGVDLMVIWYSWFTTEDIGRRHETVMQDRLGILPTSWRGYLWGFDEIEPAAVLDSIGRIRARKYRVPCVIIPDLKDENIPRYYQEPANTFGYTRCIYPWLEVDVMPNGDVTPCRDFPDYIVGNIQDGSILDIFNGGRYRRFRKALKESGGLFPICARCCGLMGW